jgi:2-polyprenyl-3-methyl-5-hydroxy-6-metoxy-1,4-benzoquinol methylase
LLPSGKALELGCYKGEFTSLLASRYPDLTVIEAADSLIEIAKTRVGDNVRFICSTFEELSMDERFDAIFLLHTLEHLDAPIEILKRISGWLTDTGKLFLAVPNANAPSRQIAVKMGLISHNTAVTPAEQEHGHRKTYTFDTLEAEAVRAGLDVMARGGIFFKPLANYQFDKLMSGDVVTREYMEGCYKLGMQYPDLCASIYLICGRTAPDRA